MNKDIRISVGLPRHPKMIKLRRKAGADAFRCLITLWCFAAENKPNGCLQGMDYEDIAIASGWDDEDTGKWVDSLIACGFVDETESGLQLHDWEENNPWAAGAEQRSEKAKNAAKSRHAKREAATSSATSTNEQCSEQDLAHQVGDSSNAPSPSPSPSPDSEDNASGANAPQADLKSIVFNAGLDWLAKQTKKPEDKLRSALGRACRDHGEAMVIEVLAAAQREGAIDPLAWMERAFAARSTARPKTTQGVCPI